MNNFLEKWKTDKKYQTKIKLSLYTLFVVIVAIFAISSNNSSTNLDIQENNSNNQETNLNNNSKENSTLIEENIIELPDEYDYDINITIDNQLYRYYGTKDNIKMTITKEVGETITNYIYEDDNYYIEIDEVYTLTTKEEVYDVVNYNYLNIENINKYLTQGKVVDEQYQIYLKDIILGNESEDYITITIKDEIDIDYTNMIKYFNNDIEEYIVNIKIEERNEEVN